MAYCVLLINGAPMRGLRAIPILIVLASAALIQGSVPRDAAPAPDATHGAEAPTWTPVTDQKLSHGRFENFTVYSPHAAPRGFVLLLSGADGWNQEMSGIAQRLGRQGAMVAGIDVAQLDASLQADGAECVFPDGDLENLSHFVQAYYHLATYLSPILAGHSAGATLAYATLAQAPTNTFAGAVSMEFCPAYPLRKHLCKGSGIDSSSRVGGGVEFLPSKQVGNPWVVVQHAESQACDAGVVRSFVAQVPHSQLIIVPGAESNVAAAFDWTPQYSAVFDTLMAQNAPASMAAAPAALADLPIVAIAAQPGAPPSDTFAIMLSGDGGWAGLDKEVAGALSANGIPVVGLDSLRYFWTPRTPDGLAADLDRMIRFYLVQLRKQRVALVGYSQGADVLPFAVNRLPPASRAQVALTAVMGMSEHALFEFHVSSWISDDNSGPATLPEVERITGMPVLCIYGEDETDSLCPRLDSRKVTVVKLKGGHHFDGNYAGLARTILESAGR
jgi:type IV secretory pathway VirJ component